VKDKSQPLGLWVWISYAFLATCLGMFLYMGSQPGGANAIWVYRFGRFFLAIGALFFLPIAFLCAWRSKPMITRPRGIAFACLAGTVGLATWPVPYRTPYPASTIEFQIPVEGTWRVLLGGRGDHANPLRLIPSRCTGLQLVRDVEGAPIREGAAVPPTYLDHLAFGETVIAPCAGEVVRAVGDLPDLPASERRRIADIGNHVVLEVAEGEYLYLANLQEGSLQVQVGDRVQTGQSMGRVGASSRANPSSAPHLEVFLASHPDLNQAEGVPWSLFDYVADGAPIRSGIPLGGVARGGAWVGQVIEASR
jgi:hypothetical protein